MDIKDVKLRKGMNKEVVNTLISEWIELIEDDVYLGDRYRHNWKCKCGNIITNRMFRSIRHQNATDCGCVKYNKVEQRYKEEVEKTGEYEYIRSFRDGELLPSGIFVNRNIHLQVKHKYCNTTYEVEVGSFINKNIGCSKCCKTYENSFAHHIEVELGEPLEKYWDFEKNTVNPYHIYKRSHTKVWIKCQSEEVNELNGLKKKDYHDSYTVVSSDFAIGRRCSYCHSKSLHTYDSFGYHNPEKAQSWSINNDISPFRVSRNNGEEFKFTCDCCGVEFKKRISNITSHNQWCPECSMSKGEKKIAEWLRYNNIEYEYEKMYKGLVGLGGGNLSYDFYLPYYNILIEYQGRQHNEYIPGFHSKYNDFEYQQEHDRRKCEYANVNNIKLIEIWEDDKNNIEEILNKELINSNKLI